MLGEYVGTTGGIVGEYDGVSVEPPGVGAYVGIAIGLTVGLRVGWGGDVGKQLGSHPPGGYHPPGGCHESPEDCLDPLLLDILVCLALLDPGCQDAPPGTWK